MIHRIMCVTFVLLYSTFCYAMFCPKNFNQINIGDTPEQVAKQCGMPSSQKNIESDENQPQEWTYYIQDPGTLPLLNGQIQTYKFTFFFDKGIVFNISGNGTSLANTSLCNNTVINTGTSTIQEVKAACGAPAMISKSTSQGKEGLTNITEWKYDGPPVVTLVFEKGKLKERL